MIQNLFGSNTLTYMLRGGLEEASITHRGIADRVAGALTQSSSTDFPGQLEGAQQASQADLERDMAALVDTQLRYEAEAKLLHAAYGRLRTAVGRA